MAITKKEGITGDLVVIYYQGNWYGIPLGQVVQVESAQRRYGLNTTISKVVQQEVYVDVNRGVRSDDVVRDMVQELRLRIEQMNSGFVEGLKTLIGQNSVEWQGVLNSTIIP